MHIVECDDGSILVEWVLDDNKARFYISLEEDPLDCGWGYVTKDTEVSQSGFIPPRFYAVIQKWMSTHYGW